MRPAAAKTRIVTPVKGGEGLDFLGFYHRYVRGRLLPDQPLRWLCKESITTRQSRLRAQPRSRNEFGWEGDLIMAAGTDRRSAPWSSGR